MKPLLKNYRHIRNILLHVLTWVGILSILYFLQHSTDNQQRDKDFDKQMQLHFLLIVTVLALLFYLNSYVLIPYFLYRKRIIFYLLINLSLLLAFIEGMNSHFRYIQKTIRPQAMLRISPGRKQMFPPGPMSEPPGIRGGPPRRRSLPYAVTLLPFLMTVISSIAFRYITDSIKNENNRKEERMATLTSELQLLKSQVSPHFLFNVLNNLTYLARKQSAILEPALIKLSSLLRYMLYDTNEEKVLLDKEIKYLEDYIELQQIRHQDLVVSTYFTNEEEDLMIAPMLLIPFVENAFKHAGSFVDDNSFIKIELVTSEKELYFKVENKCTLTQVEQKDKSSGIGLANVQKRLQLIYPGLHHLSIERSYNIHTVILKINL